jgi:hypothetical protein
MNFLKILSGVLLFLIFYSNGRAQSLSELSVKEDYDYYNYLLKNKFSACKSNFLSDSSSYGNKYAYVLESNLDMYELTKDKAYLYHFIEMSLCLVENRKDYFFDDFDKPVWVEKMYENGNILAALSRFVFVVNSNHLNRESLYPFPFIADNSFGKQFATFGAYSSWIQDRCGETIWYYLNNGNWTNRYGFKKSPLDDVPAEINMQSGFARALLFIGICSGEELFLQKVSIIESLMLGYLEIDDGCNDFVHTIPVFATDTITNSYSWYHSGWKLLKDGCILHPFSDNSQAYTEYHEDIGHAILVLNMALDFYHYHASTNISVRNMERFKNMFTKKIYISPGNFANSVFGELGPIYFNGGAEPYPEINTLKVRALSYAPLSEFDCGNDATNSPGVYDIIMSLYESEYYHLDFLPFSGLDNWGHAKVVRMQWDNSCPDLHLYRRQVVYNQDFWSKGDLMINGMDERVDYTFMHPTDFNLPVFEIDCGVSSKISASNEIDLKNFHAKEGSDVHIFVNEELSRYKSPAGIEK